MYRGVKFDYPFIYQNLTADVRRRPGELPADIPPQLSLFEAPPPPDFLLSPAAGHRTLPGREEVAACQTGEI